MADRPEISDSVVRAAFEGASVGMALTDLQGQVLKANAAFEELIGYDEATLQTMRFLDFTHEDDRGYNQDLFVDLIAGRRPAYQFEKRYVHASGRVFWVRLTTAVVRDADGGIRYVMGTAEDIQAEREAQQRLEAMEARLEQARRLEAIGRVTAGVVHDFKNILNVVVNYADMLLTDLPEGSRLREDARQILACGERADDLIASLLAFSDDKPLPRRPVDLNALLSEMRAMLDRLPGEAIDLVVDLAPDLPPASAHPAHLQRVVLNLVANARKAMPEGGTVRLATRVDGQDRLVLEVADTGVGMDASTRERIFEPFFTTRGGEGGTGLGLAIVYGVIRRTGGQVEVDSAPGEGTTFTVRLPAAT